VSGAGDGDGAEGRFVERCHELVRATQNPVYAWLAIEHLFLGRDGLSPDWPVDKDLVLPGWIAAYLQQAAERLNMLAAGVDFRVETPPLDFTKFSTVKDAMNSPEHRQHVEASRVAPPDAMKIVPAALGLTRAGRWNAFADYGATTQKMQEFRVYQAMRANGVPSKQAVPAIGDAIEVRDPSHVFDRIREGRRLATNDEAGNAPPAGSPSGICTP
jgi:hypothetical protein